MLSGSSGSRMNREVHVPICKQLGVKFPGRTPHCGPAAAFQLPPGPAFAGAHPTASGAVRLVQNSGVAVQAHRRSANGTAQAGRRSPGYFLSPPFFAPASGKIHMAITMKTAVIMTKVAYSERIGEPPQ